MTFELSDLFDGEGIEFLILLARNYEGTGGISGFDNGEERVPNNFHFSLDDHALTWPTLKVHLERRWLSFVLGYENAEAAELLIEVGETGSLPPSSRCSRWWAPPTPRLRWRRPPPPGPRAPTPKPGPAQ